MKTIGLLSDEELVKGCLDGKRSIQRNLYDRYADAMFKTARAMMSSNDLASDVVQEAFIMVFRRLHTFRFESSLGSWIKRIVCNTAINHLRKKKNLLDLQDGTAVTMVHEEDDTQFEDDILHIEVLKKAMDKMPDGYRTILSLYVLEGYDHGEIAQILNIAESTSKTQYMRAKRKLKELATELMN